jgi:hypothetical protein
LRKILLTFERDSVNVWEKFCLRLREILLTFEKILLTSEKDSYWEISLTMSRQNRKSLSQYYFDFEYFILKRDQEDVFRERIFFESTLFYLDQSFNVATERFFLVHVFYCCNQKILFEKEFFVIRLHFVLITSFNIAIERFFSKKNFPWFNIISSWFRLLMLQ